MKRYRYEVGGYSGDQLGSLVQAMVGDANTHHEGTDTGRARLREVAAAILAALDGEASALLRETPSDTTRDDTP